MILTLVNKKGGCGKTSLACLLALYWAERGKKVAIQDLDPQGSADAFVSNIDNENIVAYRPGRSYDHIITDTQGGIRPKELKIMVEQVDLALIPFLLSPTDMRATGDTVRLLGEEKKARLVFNKVNPATTIFRDRSNYANILGVRAIKSHLGDRVSYKHALVDGWGALNAKSKEELTLLVKEIEKNGQK